MQEAKEKTVVQEITAKAEEGDECTQLWLSNAKFKDFVKEVEKPCLNAEGQLVFVEKGANFDTKFAIALGEECKAKGDKKAFAKITKISQVDRYSGITTKSVFISPDDESPELIEIL